MKKRLLFLLPAFVGMLLMTSTFASSPPFEKIKIQGIVRDFQSRQVLQGITVKAKSNEIGTATDVNGRFSLEVSDDERSIMISSVGYESQEITLAGKTNFTIDLKPAASNLNEVVVVGYGTQKKADITSAVASVKASEFVKGSVIDAGQLIQGKVAGVSVSVPSGEFTC